MKSNVVKQHDKFINPFNDEHEDMKLVKIKELTRVEAYTFYNYHYYNIDSKGHKYQWFMHPLYNQQSDFAVYHHAYNLLSPKQVNKLINRYDFNLRELAMILGMSPTTLSNIKQGKYIQSVSQNNLLRLLISPVTLLDVIDGNLYRIKRNHSNINYNHFITCVHRLRND